MAVFRLYGGPACVVDFAPHHLRASRLKGSTWAGHRPGITSRRGLFSRTSTARVDLVRPPRVIGGNTVHAIQSGLIFGYVSLVEGMVARYKQELGPDLRVIGTGGLAETIARETDAIQIVNPFLTLEGLRMVWEMNQ